MQDTSMVTQRLLERIREQPVINFRRCPSTTTIISITA